MSTFYKSPFHLKLMEKKKQFRNQKLNAFLAMNAKDSHLKKNDFAKTSSSTSTNQSDGKMRGKSEKEQTSAKKRKTVSFVSESNFIQVFEYILEEDEIAYKKEKINVNCQCQCFIF